MQLDSMKPAPGSRRKRKRKGRGPGSGNGKTAGRGEKGQGARAGVSVWRHPEIFAPLTPLVFQVVRTGVSVLQPRCGMVTLLESAWPCARRVLVSEAVSSVRY